MNITHITNVTSPYIQARVDSNPMVSMNEDDSFDKIFKSALGMLEETNSLENAAESAEIQFALGESTNTHDLQVAQEEANIALQYTVAVRDKALESYQSIMNMQM